LIGVECKYFAFHLPNCSVEMYLRLKVAYLRLCVAIRATQNILKTMDPKTSYTNLLFSQSQTTVDLDSPEPFWLGSQGPNESVVEPVVESGGDPKERRKWCPKEDKILISAWLNTSKDAVVSNDQRLVHSGSALSTTTTQVRNWLGQYRERFVPARSVGVGSTLTYPSLLDAMTPL